MNAKHYKYNKILLKSAKNLTEDPKGQGLRRKAQEVRNAQIFVRIPTEIKKAFMIITWLIIIVNLI